MAITPQVNLIKEFGLENLPEEKRMEIMLSLGRIVQQNVILRILEQMDERIKGEFDRFLARNKDNQEEVNKFLQSKVPGLDRIISEEVEKLKKDSNNFIQGVIN